MRSSAAAGLVVATALLFSSAGCARSESSDAFELSRPTTTYTGFAISEQSRDFHVAVGLDHPGSTIQIIDVKAHTSRNVEYLGAVTVWPRDLERYNIGAGVGYPPESVKRTHPISEPVPPAETLFEPRGFGEPGAVAVVAGFRLASGDIGAMNGIRVVYEVDGKRMIEDSSQAGIACLRPKQCEGPGGLDDPEFEKRVLFEAGLLPKDD